MERESSFRKWCYCLILVLLFPALLINLGLMTLIEDEGIRALVALEMKMTGNLVTPTMLGDYYYLKPPLFNWIILVFYNLTGNVDEFTARLPTIICLLGYGATIFHFLRKHYDFHHAFLAAFLFITCGRILFWDSMLALIDICFSWVTFTLFMVVYHEFEKGRWLRLFLLSYLLTSIGFLLKGLPSVVFQGTTLLVYFVYKGEFKRLFSMAHILGGLLFLFLVGTYYGVYASMNSLESVWESLFSESTKRTIISYGLGRTILHFFTFPFEMVYHFIPWSLMIIYFLKKGIFKVLLKDSFVTYCLLMFLANIFVYWTSPGVFPRYLLMHAPLIFIVYLYLHNYHKAEQSLHFKIVNILFFVLCAGAALGSIAPLFVKELEELPLLIPKVIGISSSLFLLTYLFWKRKDDRILIMILFLIIFRIGFNWYILPARNADDFGNLCRLSSKEMGDSLKDKELYVYKLTLMPPMNCFYLTNERGAIIRRKLYNFEEDALYIIEPERYPSLSYEKVGSFTVREGKQTYDIGYLK